jgi:hypothetical protein
MDKRIEDFLRAKTHQDVIELFESGVNLNNFTVTHSLLWSLYVPKDILTYCPALNAHTDTVFAKPKQKPTRFVEINSVITNAEANYGIGADDRAGCYIMHKLIKEGQQFIYVITDKEECGGIGGDDFAKSQEFQDILGKTSCFIGLDRRGGSDCASYGFDNKEMFGLMEEYGGYTYAFGSFTDVMTFADNSELACCNLSIGYENEHRATESLNLFQMEYTYKFLSHFLPEVFWEQQFIAEVSTNKYSKSYWEGMYGKEEEEHTAILCDMCQVHAPLYDVGWGMVCKTCITALDGEFEEVYNPPY